MFSDFLPDKSVKELIGTLLLLQSVELISKALHASYSTKSSIVDSFVGKDVLKMNEAVLDFGLVYAAPSNKFRDRRKRR